MRHIAQFTAASISTTARRSRRERRVAALAATLSVFAFTVAIPTQSAVADPPLKSQAIGIMNLTYDQFMKAKASPTRNGRFDWASDGCSAPWLFKASTIVQAAIWMHNAPCQQHDFGRRNFGHGLTLERTESRRNWIDARFRSELNRNCNDHWWYPSCHATAGAVYVVMRAFSDKWAS